MDDKVYTNEVIPDVAFPAQPNATTVTDTPNFGTKNGNTPAGNSHIPSQSLPIQLTAIDLISVALNTKTKKILQTFGFAPSGAIQIGSFTPGVSGDIRISPNGILARNLLGDTTFTLDGDTGDAIFQGEVRSGTTVTGDVTILDGGHLILYDDLGNPSIFIGEL